MRKGNKFLERYPALWEPRIGDRVRIISVYDFNNTRIDTSSSSFSWYYQIGDVGIIEETESSNSGYILYHILFDRNNKMYVTYRHEIELINE
jgi:hypothetical protein